jgi:hypothetical protein
LGIAWRGRIEEFPAIFLVFMLNSGSFALFFTFFKNFSILLSTFTPQDTPQKVEEPNLFVLVWNKGYNLEQQL